MRKSGRRGAVAVERADIKVGRGQSQSLYPRASRSRAVSLYHRPMALSQFPDPREATEDGVVAVGGRPEPALLEEAYARGIFPWPVDGYPLLWFSPPERALLFFEELHVPRSLARERRRTRLTFTLDRAFERVIRACAEVERAHEAGTWITPWMVRGYCEFHRLGGAHSAEAWEGGELV